MRRRTFLRLGGLLGAAALAGAVGPRTSRAAAPGRWLQGVRAFELDEKSIGELQAGMAAGKYSALSLTKKYLSRIEQIDRYGPTLRSVIEVNPDALRIAEFWDKERKIKGPRGPLHGIPILIKDNLDTHDRMTTTAGSLALEGSVPPRDSFVADRLREAGAVILGKTNLSEWANFRSTRSTSGWSGRGGQTRNPYALDRNPSGSSSGSAVAVAANLCAAAVGTETDGSIVSPASTNGIVGIKPTVGLISRAGIVPISHTQDTAGPMARTVTDAAILLGLMAGEDPRDPSTGPSSGRAYPDYTRFLDVDGLRGARLGIVREHFKMHPQVEILMESVVSQLKQLGAVLVDPVALAHTKDVAKAEDEVLSYEFKAGINAYLASLGPTTPRRTLRELIEFNERNRDREMPWFGQELFIEAEARGPLTDQAYLDALEKCRRLSRDEGIDALMKQHQLDALVAPTSQPAWAIDWVCGDHWLGGSSTAAAVAGYPSITVPAGLASGLPVGVSFFGRAWDEPALLRMAFAFEQATLLRQPPRFLPSVVAGDPLTFRGLPRES